ncbi:MAG: hypothetical protein J7K72_00500 [Candidatus Aenigmarchaeota archaeon]|nr:hypothetical protein [Candidatus Aenigmarchaeota archaeon]
MVKISTPTKFAVLVFFVILAAYAVNILNTYWMLMFAVLYLVIGVVRGVILLGSGKANMTLGFTLILLGGLLVFISTTFPK